MKEEIFKEIWSIKFSPSKRKSSNSNSATKNESDWLKKIIKINLIFKKDSLMINFKMKREESKSNMSHKSNKSEKNSTKKLKDFRTNLTEWQVEVNSPTLNGSIKSER